MKPFQETSDALPPRALIYPNTPIHRRTFSLEDAFYEYARTLGGGNASKGLRVALAYYADEHRGSEREE